MPMHSHPHVSRACFSLLSAILLAGGLAPSAAAYAPARTVSVRGSATPLVATRGTAITYSIYVRNDNRQAQSVNLRAYLDTRAVWIESMTAGGYSDGSSVRWDNLTLGGNTSRTYQLIARVQDNAPLNEPILLHLQAGASSDTVTVNVIQSDNFYGNDRRYSRQVVRPSYDYNRSYRPPVYRYERTRAEPPRYYSYSDDYYRSRYNDALDYSYDYYSNNRHYRDSDYWGYPYSEDPGFYCDSSRFICR